MKFGCSLCSSGSRSIPGREGPIFRRLQLEQAEVFACLFPDTPEERAMLLRFRVGAPPVEDVVVIPHHQGWHLCQQR